MKNILVTGGSGFVGTNIVNYYLAKGCNVLNVDILPPRNSAHIRFWRKVDICDTDRLSAVVRDFSPDLILHMAARTDLNGLNLQDYRVNTDGVKSIIEVAAHLSSLERVVFASSMLVCSLGYQPKDELDYSPNTFYGESKVIGEQLVRTLVNGRFSWTIVRPTSLWGPWFGVPYKNFFDAVSSQIYVHPKGRRIERSYGFVLNAVHQLDCLIECPNIEMVDEKTFYLADYKPIELYQWSSLISKSFGVRRPMELPLIVLRFLAWIGDALKFLGVKAPPLSSFRLKNLLTEAVFDMKPLELVAGECPYDVEAAVRITVAWIKSQSK